MTEVDCDLHNFIAGDRPRSRKAYDDFFTFWRNADRDIPILQAARSEYRANEF